MKFKNFINSVKSYFELNHNKKKNPIHRTDLQITSGYYHFWVHFFHILPWIFVTADFVIGTLLLHRFEEQLGFVVLFVLIAIELGAMYIYQILLGISGRKIILKTFKTLNFDNNSLYKSLKENSKFYSVVRFNKNPDVLIKSQAKTKSDKEEEANYINGHEGVITIKINSIWDILTLKRAYVDVKIISDQDNFITWTSYAFLNAKKRKFVF